jgi:phage tail tape-measure protein
MRVKLTLCAMVAFLAAGAAAVSAEGMQKYLSALAGVSSSYRSFAEQVAEQGFFREPI